jgi:hypothetical protein
MIIVKIYHLYLANRELEADGQRITVRLPPTTPLTAVHRQQPFTAASRYATIRCNSYVQVIYYIQVCNLSGFHETLTWMASPFERVSEWTVRDSAMVQKEGGSRSSVSY